MEKRKNDKGQSQHTEGSDYQENWWLDEEDSEELPVFNLDEAEDYDKHRQRLTGEPVIITSGRTLSYLTNLPKKGSAYYYKVQASLFLPFTYPRSI